MDTLDGKGDLPPKLGLRNLLYPTVRFSKPGRESLSLLPTSALNRFPWTHILEKKTGLGTRAVYGLVRAWLWSRSRLWSGPRDFPCEKSDFQLLN